MMKRKPTAAKKKPAAKPAAKKKGGKMPPELLAKFQKMNAAKAEAKGQKSGADKRKGTARGTGMMSPKKGTSAKK